MVVIPETWWVEPAKWLGGMAITALTAWKLYISNKAVDGVKFQMVVTAMPLHDSRLRILEDAKLIMQQQVENIDTKTDAIDARTTRMSEQLNQLIGSVNAQGKR